MSITIDQIAKQNAKLPINLDSMGERYKTSNEKFTFTAPMFWTIEKNLFYLQAKSTRKKFDVKYKMRPDYLSYDEYDTVVLAPLLMYVNGIFSVEDFDLNEVIIPDFDVIIKILRDRFPFKSKDDMEEINW